MKNITGRTKEWSLMGKISNALYNDPNKILHANSECYEESSARILLNQDEKETFNNLEFYYNKGTWAEFDGDYLLIGHKLPFDGKIFK